MRADPRDSYHSSGGSGAGLLAAGLVAGIVFIVGPFVAESVGLEIQSLAQILLVGFGVFLMLASAIMMIVTRLYRKTAADEAFVRTGMGGERIIIDGGALVVGIVHDCVPVSLRTMRLVVERNGQNALITADNLRADVTAEFYIRVDKTEEAVKRAATSLGERSTDPENVKQLVFEKLVSALRGVAATKELNSLHSDRKAFEAEVQAAVADSLEANGLTLESVTISKLDQTATDVLRPDDNVFDAQGRRKIAEITQKARVETNQLTAEADKKVAEQDVERDEFVYAQQVGRANAAAARDRQIADAEASAGVAEVDKQKHIDVASVARQQAVEVANVERQRAMEVAEEQRQQAQEEANVARRQSVQIKDRDADIQIANKERDRAVAEAERLKAEAEQELAAQRVQTVTVSETAEREKTKTVIDKQAAAEAERIALNNEADIEAYHRVKQAEAEREAAAERAEAIMELAKADKEAALLRAEGARADQMVPVDVDRERVGVEDARVDVKERDLAIQTKNEAIAKELQISLAQIEAEKVVRVESAKAFGQAMATAKMTIWGDPTTMSRMSEAFFRGQGWGEFAEGLANGTPPELKKALALLGDKGLDGLSSLFGNGETKEDD